MSELVARGVTLEGWAAPRALPTPARSHRLERPESFNASLKVERVHRTVYSTANTPRKDVTRYIESATIRSVSTRRSATERRMRFTTSTSIGRSQRNQDP